MRSDFGLDRGIVSGFDGMSIGPKKSKGSEFNLGLSAVASGGGIGGGKNASLMLEPTSSYGLMPTSSNQNKKRDRTKDRASKNLMASSFEPMGSGMFGNAMGFGSGGAATSQRKGGMRMEQ
jgi:hypothetical protein